MKKLNWFSRLFMSWKALVTYFEAAQQATINDFQTTINDYKVTIGKLEIEISGQKTRLAELTAWHEEKTQIINNHKTQNEAFTAEIKQLQFEKATFETNSLQAAKRDQEELARFAERLSNLQKERDKLDEKISNKLLTIEKIEKTFFAKAGSKGKGELGELQLEAVLSKSGIDANTWTKNLVVGENKTVEFAISAGEGKKWIPIDSKVIETDVDDENKIIIDEKYRDRVRTQARKVHDYLDKKNTTSYGLLVLQSDEIYLKLFDAFPTFFDEMIREQQVYVCAPSSFIQFAWSMAHILEIYKQVHQDKKIYDEVVKLLTSVNKLASSLVKTHKDFNTAMEKHYPTIQKRQGKLFDKFVKYDKIKELPNLNGSDLTQDDEADVIETDD